MEALLLVLIICLAIVIFGFGIPSYINGMVDGRIYHLEEALLELHTKSEKHEESVENLGKFCNHLSWTQQVDRWNFQNHFYINYHGYDTGEGIIKWNTTHKLTDEEMLKFRNWGISLNEVGKVQGYIPVYEAAKGGANVE